MNQKHLGSQFDDFLREEKLLEASEAVAVKRVIAFQIAQQMKRRKLTKTQMALRMKTSRAALERLLDPIDGETAAVLCRKESRVVVPAEVKIFPDP